jgi:hypothetical protein
MKIKFKIPKKEIERFFKRLEKLFIGKMEEGWKTILFRKFEIDGFVLEGLLVIVDIKTEKGSESYYFSRRFGFKEGFGAFTGKRKSLKDGNYLVQIQKSKIRFHNKWKWNQEEGFDSKYKIIDVESKFPEIDPWKTLDVDQFIKIPKFVKYKSNIENLKQYRENTITTKSGDTIVPIIIERLDTVKLVALDPQSDFISTGSKIKIFECREILGISYPTYLKTDLRKKITRKV